MTECGHVLATICCCCCGQDGAEFPVEDVDDRVFVDHAAGVIHFTPLYRGDDGEYRCKASNRADEASSYGRLTVVSK